jgi:hypothetical protein
MKIAKPKHSPIVREKGRRDVQCRIAQERVRCLACPMKIAKPEHSPIVREKVPRDAQRRIAQERVPTGAS